MAEFIEKEKVLSMSYCANKPTWDNPHLEPKSVVDVIDIETLPAADVVEVVHGEWIETYNEMVCSKCHMPPITKDEENGKVEILTKYCPNCGADMRRIEKRYADV